MCSNPALVHLLLATCQTTFSLMPLPHTLPDLLMARNTLPLTIPAADVHPTKLRTLHQQQCKFQTSDNPYQQLLMDPPQAAYCHSAGGNQCSPRRQRSGHGLLAQPFDDGAGEVGHSVWTRGSGNS